MKLIFADTTMGSDPIGGGQLFLPNLLKGLVQRGHDMSLITNGEPNEKVAGAIAGSGVKVIPDLWDRAGLLDDETSKVAEYINAERPDAFVISVSGDVGWVVLPHLDPRIATITIGHNDEETFYAPADYYGQFLTRAVGVSEEICRRYEEQCGIPAEGVEWIPYGVEALDVGPGESDKGPLRLLYLGRLDEIQKRVSDIAKIVKELGPRGVDFRLEIVGDGEERGTLERELRDEIVAGSVILRGWLPSDEVLGAMRSSEVFLLASAYEGFCISLTEAMANGCTPIVTDIKSGNKQLVADGENGFIVPVGDIEAFVDRIKLLAGDRGRLQAMREKAWETGREYSIDRMVENYERCFERAIEDARTDPRTPDPDFPLMPSCRSRYPLWVRRLKARALGIASRG